MSELTGRTQRAARARGSTVAASPCVRAGLNGRARRQSVDLRIRGRSMLVAVEADAFTVFRHPQQLQHVQPIHQGEGGDERRRDDRGAADRLRDRADRRRRRRTAR